MPFQDLPDRLAEVRARHRRRGQPRRARPGGHDRRGDQDVRTRRAAGGVGGRAARRRGEQGPGGARQDARMVDAPLRWHLIGHLQRNKVKQVDRVPPRPLDGQRAARRRARRASASARGRPVEVLVQVNVSGEETKGGYRPSMCEREAERLRGLAGFVVRGVMTMAPFDADEATLRAGVRRGAPVRASCCARPAIRQRSCRWGCRATTRSQSRRAPPWCASERCCSERDPPNGRDLSSHAARRAALRLRQSAARLRSRARRAVPRAGGRGARAADAPDAGARGEGARAFTSSCARFASATRRSTTRSVSAQQLRGEIREQAEREAQLILREARAEAERILEGSRERDPAAAGADRRARARAPRLSRAAARDGRAAARR